MFASFVFATKSLVWIDIRSTSFHGHTAVASRMTLFKTVHQRHASHQLRRRLLRSIQQPASRIPVEAVTRSTNTYRRRSLSLRLVTSLLLSTSAVSWLAYSVCSPVLVLPEDDICDRYAYSPARVTMQSRELQFLCMGFGVVVTALLSVAFL